MNVFAVVSPFLSWCIILIFPGIVGGGEYIELIVGFLLFIGAFVSICISFLLFLLGFFLSKNLNTQI